MKVLEINVDDVGLGGVYALVSDFIRHKGDDLKVDIACIARFENPANVKMLKRMGTDVHFIGTDGGKLARPGAYYRNALALLRRGAYDCVHIHGDVAYLLLIFAKAARRARVRRVILHSHAAGIDGGAQAVKRVLHDLAKDRLPRCADRFAACSDYAARWMFPGLDPARVSIVRNGIDVERFRFDPQARATVRRELGLEGAFVVGHVGRYTYQKNHEFLLRCFARLRGRLPRARLLLVGEGILMEPTRALARELALEDSVIFHGPSGRVNALMQAMDLLALPSRFEGLPVVGVEAQAAGLPVLFSDRITREAQLTDCVRFLPIQPGSENVWAAAAAMVAGLETDRSAGCDRVAAAGYTIEDTVRAFMRLYGD